MKIREALRVQSPSLALQRAAADEIARLDALVAGRQPLTDGQIDKMFDKAETAIYFADRERNRHLEIYWFGVRDAEAAHGIKETA